MVVVVVVVSGGGWAGGGNSFAVVVFTTQAAVDAHFRADFSAMKKMGGTAVRLYASLDSILQGPASVNETALAALAHVVDIAEAEGLLVDLTGANVMRNPPGGPEKSWWPFPSWLVNVTDGALCQLAARPHEPANPVLFSSCTCSCSYSGSLSSPLALARTLVLYIII